MNPQSLLTRAALLVAITLPAEAQFCDVDVAEITPSLQAQFGSTVALSPSGRYAAVGAPFGSVGGCAGGTVTLFQLVGTQWTPIAELGSPSGECDGQFGYDVALTESVLVVGAPFEDAGGAADSGRVYLYRPVAGTWTLFQTLTEVNIFSGARFGHSVAVQDQRVAVGSIRSNFFGPSAGAAYVYRNFGGQYAFEDRLAPDPPQPGAFFGTSVSLFGPYCAVGAVYENATASQSGAAYVFERQPNTTWAQAAKLLPPGGASSTFYGISVSNWGPFVVVGAEGATNGAVNSGSAYMYRRVPSGTWTFDAELTSPSPLPNGTFGRAVSMTDGKAVVTDFTGAGGGLAALFERVGTAWVLDQTFTPSNPSNTGAFGTECAIQPSALIVGAPLRTTTVAFSGGASIYALDFVDCNGNGINDVCELASFGSIVDCDGNGVIDSCEIAANPALDCDGDGLLDSCEIANAPNLDCDGNGILDDCEIAANPALDCNFNGRLDICDLALGIGSDVNGNLVIDDCEPLGTAMNCQFLPNSSGQPGELRAIGTGTVAANDVTLIGSQFPLDVFGFPIVSRSPGANVPPNSVGFLCLGGTVGRDYSNIFNTGLVAGAEIAIGVDVQLIPQGTSFLSAVAGETWYWQLWHRDNFGGQNTSTFTDSLRITFQ